ncbi:MAG: ribosomal subunit interface protein [candidate division Zixibacteria bacterium RBG_16_40_9]|nr:MAG: ribosomal subunit interface protein [candidate division Zixibacteria bacterium RBG_16_40_9]
MQIRITSRHFQLIDALKEFAEKEITQLEKYFDSIIDCNLILDTERYKQVAELRVKVYGTVLNSKVKSEDMKVSIEKAVEKVATQLKKHSSKLKEKNPKKIEALKSKSSSPVETGLSTF